MDLSTDGVLYPAMLRWRLTLGILLIATFIGLCWLDHAIARRGLVAWCFLCGFGMMATGELLAFFRKGGRPLRPHEVYAAVAVTIAAAGIPLLAPAVATSIFVGSAGWLAIGMVSGFALVLLGEMRLYRRPDEGGQTTPGETTVHLALAVLAVVYVGGLLGFFMLLRLLPVGAGGRDWGLLALVSMIAVVKLGDTGAYTAGRLFGRHKMIPRLSPGKTWEGAAGGLAAACLGAWMTLSVVPAWLGWTGDGTDATTPWPAWLAYGLVVGIAGMLGDLAESLLKRDASVKDSSSWLPGFGGVLDLLDSLLFAAPVAYLFWIAGVVGP